ncbi:MAG: UDP-2,3-diacylglucosamine diphosphatase [Deltaproteobacteria bacterium]|nr:UDP-2,3-diacylglucosamine diphosphatase [Deltaproteobacteria bacterium]TLN02555.1 MAG: UDP-2,3-diacylglucosamine diphosphatase [bacterium]
MKSIFLADAHLRNPSDDNYQLLLLFLSEIQGKAKKLFILGDLFEFWIGYNERNFPHYLPLLDSLTKLTESGVEIVYFEGNHDFHLGKFFSETLRATIYTNPAIVELDGKQVFICHGDQINSHDYGYRFFRFLLHNPATKILFPLVPAALVFRIAKKLSSRSKKHHQKRNIKQDYNKMLRLFADSKFRIGCDAVVTAHFHFPQLTIAENGNTLLSLGDWITQFSYGEFSAGKFSLHTYR